MRACCEAAAPRSIGRKPYASHPSKSLQERAMTIHQYLMQACKDDAQRAGERDRVLLEARRLGLMRCPGAGLVVPVTRGARLLSRWAVRAQDRLEKRARPPEAEVQPTPD
jgi:hypothetical protein